MREIATNARDIQRRRFENGRADACNAVMPESAFAEWCPMAPDAEELLFGAQKRLRISARGRTHVIRVARTIADLILIRRRQGQLPDVVAIAIKAQHRLYKKFWRLDERKHRHVAITAVARELTGFVWAILKAVSHSRSGL